MFITKMSLPRRMFLRGMGTALALPLLDAMVPALSALAVTGAKPARRLGFVYVPNGVIQDQWVPATTGGPGPPRTSSFPRLAHPRRSRQERAVGSRGNRERRRR